MFWLIFGSLLAGAIGTLFLIWKGFEDDEEVEYQMFYDDAEIQK